MSKDGPRLVSGDGEPTDPRVSAVLEVLAGDPVAEVARRWVVDPALVHRWVRSFVAAGTAQVTNRPAEGEARQRDRFLAAFAHETRTPLAVAQGWVSLLLDGDVPLPAAEDIVARLHDALARLAERTRDVELLAAASLGLVEVEVEDVTAGELLAALDPSPEIGGDGSAAVLRVDPELFSRIVRDLWV